MLDIKYFKQIDEVLEVDGFSFKSRKGLVIDNAIDSLYVDCPELVYSSGKYNLHEQIYVEGRTLEPWQILDDDNPVYKVYLLRVCESMGFISSSDDERELLIKTYFDEGILWRDIPSYRGLYQVSSNGNVRRTNSIRNKGAAGDERELKKYIDDKGYYRVTLSKNNKTETFLVSRLVAMVYLDEYHEYLEVDHKDRNPLNNHISNIRMATRCLNGSNIKKRPNTSSKYKGVHFHTRSRKWVSKLVFNKKQYNIGHFKSEEDAARAYDKKVLELNGDFGTTNEGLGLFMDHIKEKV